MKHTYLVKLEIHTDTVISVMESVDQGKKSLKNIELLTVDQF